MNEFRREVRFEPGHVIRRTRGNGSDYGIASMQIRFLLHGEHGTTQFAMFTGWYPEKVPGAGRYGDWHVSSPSGLDLGAHWDAPWYEGMEESAYQHMDCDFRPSGKCWYDGSSLRAEDVLTVFFEAGDAAVWAALEDEYQRIDADARQLREAQP